MRKKYSELWKSWQDQLEEGLDRYFPDQKDREAYAYLLMLLIDGLTVQEALENSDEKLNERVKTLLVEEKTNE